MGIAIDLIYNVGLLFLMLIPGLLLAKCKLATEGLGKGLANLVLYIAQPALVIVAYIRPYSQEILWNLLYVFLFSVVAHLVFVAITFFLYRSAPDRMKTILRFATIFANAGYMGLPLLVAVLGAEAAIYASIYSITFNVFIWSLGVFICTGDKKQASFKKVILHPVVISSILGLLLFFLRAEEYVPSLATGALTMLKDLVAPLSMIIIGLRLAEIDLRGIFRDKYLYQFLFMRLLALPFVVFCVMKGLALLGLPISSEVMTVILVSASTPAATATSMFAEKFDCDAVYAGKLVSISTILSIATMPLLSLLLEI